MEYLLPTNGSQLASCSAATPHVVIWRGEHRRGGGSGGGDYDVIHTLYIHMYSTLQSNKSPVEYLVGAPLPALLESRAHLVGLICMYVCGKMGGITLLYSTLLLYFLVYPVNTV